MNNFENRFWITAAQMAAEAGMEFTVPCARNVRDLFISGARVMERQGRVSENDLENAEASLHRLVGEMLRVTGELGLNALSGGRLQIREAALVQAKELCPLWPFG